MKKNIFKILLIAIFAISYSSAKEYSIGFLIEIYSEKAQKYNKAYHERDRLYEHYGRNCSDYSTYCWEKAMNKANSSSGVDRFQDDASEYLKRLTRAYEKNPIKLTEKQIYLIDSAGFGVPRDSKLFKAAFKN